MDGLTGKDLLRLPVTVRGIRVGRVVDLLLHPTEERALGADVFCRDERHRFLPFAAASLRSGAFELTSPLVLLDLRPDSFYRLEARPLSDLRGAAVAEGLRLEDVVLAPDWTIVGLVLDDPDGPRRIPLDGVVLPPRRRRSARLSG